MNRFLIVFIVFSVISWALSVTYIVLVALGKTRCQQLKAAERGGECLSIIYRGATGVVGATGLNGVFLEYVGATGQRGATGVSTIGATGFEGATGFQGATGELGSGQTGDKGYQGSTGGRGYQGATGLATRGIQGATGAVGATGSAGATGVVGATGVTGVTGAVGGTGLVGSTGLAQRGAQGPDGAAGTAGATGAAGAAGATGAVGSTGHQGVEGAPFIGGGGSAVDGATGSAGATGTAGATGAAGAVGRRGNISATGSRGVQGTRGIVGATGAAGDAGYSGATGAYPFGSLVAAAAFYTTAPQSIPANQTTYVEFANEDPGGHGIMQNNWLFTFTSEGYYVISVSVHFETLFSTDVTLAINKDSDSHDFGQVSKSVTSTDPYDVTSTIVLYMEAGSTIRVKVSHKNATGSVNIGGNTAHTRNKLGITLLSTSV